MLFVSYFRGLIERDLVITIELKNGLELKGRLAFVDKNMNFHLNNVEVEDMTKFPHFLSLKNCFIRGSSIRYVHVPENEVDRELLQEACKRELNGELEKMK